VGQYRLVPERWDLDSEQACQTKYGRLAIYPNSVAQYVKYVSFELTPAGVTIVSLCKKASQKRRLRLPTLYK
jgi:hypothetical protein